MPARHRPHRAASAADDIAVTTPRGTCTVADTCPSSPGYLPCSKQADCDAFGGGKICCEAGGMRFCTKQSACTGRRLP